MSSEDAYILRDDVRQIIRRLQNYRRINSGNDLFRILHRIDLSLEHLEEAEHHLEELWQIVSLEEGG